jgi:hypothetical protein
MTASELRDAAAIEITEQSTITLVRDADAEVAAQPDQATEQRPPARRKIWPA